MPGSHTIGLQEEGLWIYSAGRCISSSVQPVTEKITTDQRALKLVIKLNLTYDKNCNTKMDNSLA